MTLEAEGLIRIKLALSINLQQLLPLNPPHLNMNELSTKSSQSPKNSNELPVFSRDENVCVCVCVCVFRPFFLISSGFPWHSKLSRTTWNSMVCHFLKILTLTHAHYSYFGAFPNEKFKKFLCPSVRIWSLRKSCRNIPNFVYSQTKNELYVQTFMQFCPPLDSNSKSLWRRKLLQINVANKHCTWS